MLQSLVIKNFALIEDLKISFNAGLNILTGETGAGKSIIIDALNAVLGGKVGPSSIRNSADKAYIEAVFNTNSIVTAWLKQQELLDQDGSETIVCREITKTGSRVRINGTLVNHSHVQELRQLLVTIHAQHEARTLLSHQSQLEMLDALGDASHKKLIENIRTLYYQCQDLAAQLKDLQISEEERLRRLDFARFQLNELTEAQLFEANEDELLDHKRNILANVAQLDAATQKAQALLYSASSESSSEVAASAVDLLQEATVEIDKGFHLDNELKQASELLASCLAGLEELNIFIRRYRQKLDTDPETLAQVESRLAVLASIKRKYGPTLDEAIKTRIRLVDETEELENSESTLAKLSDELAQTSKQLADLSQEVSHLRKKLAKKLSESVEKELADLGMERCRFHVAVEALPDVTSSGIDRVEFMIAPNPGQPSLPLSRIGSGGELSRVMLAIKSVFAHQDQVSSVIFDEIDTGLSGKALQSMRDKLARLARSHQILCITHQPVIASVADNHIEVSKQQLKNNTRVSAVTLTDKLRVKSLAAMASGQDSEETTLRFVRSLLDQAAELK